MNNSNLSINTMKSVDFSNREGKNYLFYLLFIFYLQFNKNMLLKILFIPIFVSNIKKKPNKKSKVPRCENL